MSILRLSSQCINEQEQGFTKENKKNLLILFQKFYFKHTFELNT